jgi:hypothetical protein
MKKSFFACALLSFAMTQHLFAVPNETKPPKVVSENHIGGKVEMRITGSGSFLNMSSPKTHWRIEVATPNKKTITFNYFDNMNSDHIEYIKHLKKGVYTVSVIVEYKFGVMNSNVNLFLKHVPAKHHPAYDIAINQKEDKKITFRLIEPIEESSGSAKKSS